ncbi:MAG: tRNA uridine(34) 5-carboxymethylaminomethyl modification radical SAM/GNAT enzyme Elp3 [Nanoarchaeota archaeon]|nr:tRNA uridine(34) 5-carboxymethylaminomethyl modification radical SAM/GNAT enzyme Elp3 [Nanoarchaeota archaeon]
MSEAGFYKELETALKQKQLSKIELAKLKVKLCKKHNMKKVPTDIQVQLNTDVELKTKPVRTGSGVAVVAIMTKPYKCPHGKCAYCPGGVGSVFGDVPQSYTGHEPATLRGIRNKYDPYLQVINRLEQYIVMGHLPEKIELIIMGGTFISYPKTYRDNFIKFAFKAMNDFSDVFFDDGELDIDLFKRLFEMPGEVGAPERVKRIHQRLLKMKGASKDVKLETEQERNEDSMIKCVGLTIETRPDYAMLKHANEMLRLGATRVEVGVQSVYDEALQEIERGHTVLDTIKSFKILKDLGLKINAHYMPGLPGLSMKKDFEGMKQLFWDPSFRPDMLKIYPCMVIRGTKLYDRWKNEEYNPLTTDSAARLIANFKRHVPEYCRIMRIQRDISSREIEAGVKRTNLRQYIEKEMKKKKWKCKCIRCREPMPYFKRDGKQELIINNYEASGGQEFFISIEDRNHIYGFLRMRLPAKALRKEITKDSALIRELHVYGAAAQIGKRGEIQHKGMGKLLLQTAEDLAKKNKKKKMVVISGIGVKNYYKKKGYKKEGPYMVKKI